MAATSEGELEVKVAVEFDTSGFNETLNEVFREFKDTVIDLEVKAETAAATEEIERLQEKCDDLEYKIDEIENLYKDKMIGLSEAFNLVKNSVESLNTAIKNTGDATSIEGIENTISQLDNLGEKLDSSQVELTKLSKQNNTGLDKVAKDAEKAGKAAGDTTKELKEMGEQGAAAAKQVTQGQQDIGKAIEEITKKVQGEVAALTEAGKALNASYKTENMEQALDQLRESFSRYQTEVIKGDIKPASEAGTRIGYAYVQSILEAVEKKAPAKEIRKYLIGDFKLPKGVKLTDYFDQPDNKYTSSLLKMGNDLVNFANLYGQAIVSLNGAPISDAIKSQIEDIVEAQRYLERAEAAIPASQKAVREHPKSKREREAPLTDQEREAERARMTVALLRKEFQETLTAEADLAAANNGLDKVAEQAEGASSSAEKLEGDLKDVGQQASDTATQVTEGQQQQSQAIENTIAQAKSLQDILSEIQTSSIRELAERDFTTTGVPEARDQLKEAYQTLTVNERKNGTNPYTLQGAEDGYAYIQALKEAINKGTNVNLLAPNLYKGLGIGKDQLTAEYLNTENNAIDTALKKYEAFLIDYEQLTQRVSQATNGAQISREVRQQIEEITALQARLREAQETPKLFDISKKLQGDLDAANQKLENTLGVSFQKVEQTAQASTEAMEETVQASEKAGEAATEASDKVVEGKKAETQATQETVAAIKTEIEAEEEAVNQIKGLASAQEAMNTDFTAGGKQNAYSRLAAAAKNYKSLFGDQYNLEKITASEEGAVVGYVFAEAYKNAVDKDINKANIERYFIPGLTAQSTRRLKSSIAEGSDIDQLIKATEPIVKQSAAVYTEMSKAADEAAGKVNETAQAEKGAAESAEQAAQSTEKMTDAEQKLGKGEVGVQAETMTKFAETITDATSKLTELVEKMNEVSEASTKAMTSDDIAKQQESINGLITSLESAGEKLDSLGSKLGELTDEAKKFSEAGATGTAAIDTGQTESLSLVTSLYQELSNIAPKYYSLSAQYAYDANSMSREEYQELLQLQQAWNGNLHLVQTMTASTLEETTAMMTFNNVCQSQQQIQKQVYDREREQTQARESVTEATREEVEVTQEAVESNKQLGESAGQVAQKTEEAAHGVETLQEKEGTISSVAFDNLVEKLDMTSTKLGELVDQVTIFNSKFEDINTVPIENAAQAIGTLSGANQQAMSSAEGTAEEYKAVEVAANAAAEAEKQVTSLAQETLNKDYTITGKKAAGDNLREAYKQVQDILASADMYGDINGMRWSYTEQGAAAGYALGQAYVQGIKNGIAEGKLTTYFDQDLAREFQKAGEDAQDFTKYTLINARENPDLLSDPNNGLRIQIEGYKAILEDYANIRNEVAQQLEGNSVNDILQKDIESDIQSIVQTRAQIRDLQEQLIISQEDNNPDGIQWNTDAISISQEQFQKFESFLRSDIDLAKELSQTTTEATSAASEELKELKTGTAEASVDIVPDEKVQEDIQQIETVKTELQDVGNEFQGLDVQIISSEKVQESEDQLQELKTDIQDVKSESQKLGINVMSDQEVQDLQTVIRCYQQLEQIVPEYFSLQARYATDADSMTDQEYESLIRLNQIWDNNLATINQLSQGYDSEAAAQQHFVGVCQDEYNIQQVVNNRREEKLELQQEEIRKAEEQAKVDEEAAARAKQAAEEEAAAKQRAAEEAAAARQKEAEESIAAAEREKQAEKELQQQLEERRNAIKTLTSTEPDYRNLQGQQNVSALNNVDYNRLLDIQNQRNQAWDIINATQELGARTAQEELAYIDTCNKLTDASRNLVNQEILQNEQERFSAEYTRVNAAAEQQLAEEKAKRIQVDKEASEVDAHNKQVIEDLVKAEQERFAYENERVDTAKEVNAQAQAMTEFTNAIGETNSKLAELVSEMQKVSETSVTAMTSDDVVKQEQAINNLITSLSNAGNKLDSLGKKLSALTAEAKKFSEAGCLNNIAATANQGEIALQGESETAKELNKTLAQTPESSQQIAERAKETITNLQEEKRVTEETAQAANVSGEVAVNAEKQKQAEIKETSRAYEQQSQVTEKAAKQAGNWAQELLNKDFSRANKSASHRQLNQNFQQLTNVKSQTDDYGKINGVNWLNTKEGASAAYAAGQSWIDSFNKGRYDKLLSTQFDNDLWGDTMAFPSDSSILTANIEGVKAATAQAEQILIDYANLYDQVTSQLNGQPITPELENQIANIVNVHAMLKGAQESMDTAMQFGWDSNKEQQFISDYTKVAGDLEAELQRMVQTEAGMTSVTNEVNQDITAEAQQATEAVSQESEVTQELVQAEQAQGEAGVMANQQVQTSAEGATEGLNQVAKAEESLLAINIIPDAEALEEMGEKSKTTATSVEKVVDAEDKLIATDTASKATELQQIGDAAEAAEKPVQELEEKLQELNNTSVEPLPASTSPPEPPTPPKQQEDTSLKQKKQDIDEITEAYNTLTKFEKQYRDLSAMNPADMKAGQRENWNSISVQYENAQKVIASLSKETQLTQKQTQAQDKYNKKKQELDQIEQRSLETEQQVADTLAERQKQQEELAVQEQKAAEAKRAEAQAAQEEIDKAKAEADAIQEIIDAYARLEELEPEHQQNQAKLSSGKALNKKETSSEQQYAALKQKIDEARVSTEAITTAEQHYQQVVKDTAAIQGYQTLIKDLSEYNKLMKKVSFGENLTYNQQDRLQQLTNEMTRAWKAVNGYTAATEKAKATQDAWNNTVANSHQVAKNYTDSLGEETKGLKSLSEAQAKVEELFSSGKGGKLTWDGEQQAHGTARWGDELRKVQYAIKQIDDNQYAVYTTIKSTQTATTTWGNLIDTVSKRFSSLVAYLSTFVSFYRILGAAKSGISTVTDLNTQLTEMRKVSDESVDSLKRYQDQTFAVAKEVGSTASAIQSSTADYLRLGKSLDEAAELAKNTSILMSVSEFTDINEATESMISMTQAYKDMSSMDIIDKLNKIGNNFSISTSDLAKGMQTAASTLTVAGNSFEQSLALMTAGNAVIQDYSKTATGLRTIALRLQNTTASFKELEEMGEDVSDYEVTTTAKLAEQIEALTQVNGKKGVNILTDNGNLRDTYDILLDIAKVWKEIRAEDEITGENRQQALLEKIAGEVLPEYTEMCA